MVITSTSIKEYQPRPCARCGRGMSFGAQRPDGSWTCEPECREGAPRPHRYPDMAHDPLSPEIGADDRALARLRQKGSNIGKRKISWKPPVNGLIEVVTEAGSVLVDGDAAAGMVTGEDRGEGQRETGYVAIAYPPSPAQEVPLWTPGEARPLGRKPRRAYGRDW